MFFITISGFADQVITIRHDGRIPEYGPVGPSNVTSKSNNSFLSFFLDLKCNTCASEDVTCIGKLHFNSAADCMPLVIGITKEQIHCLVYILRIVQCNARFEFTIVSFCFMFAVIELSVLFLMKAPSSNMIEQRLLVACVEWIFPLKPSF